MQKILLSLLFAASLWGYGDTVMYWAPKISDTPRHSGDKHAGHSMGGKTAFTLVGAEDNGSAQLFLPDLSVQSLEMKKTSLTLPKPPMGGYYALVLTQRSGDHVNSAVRYLSLNGRPVKISPSKLTARSKADLEIVPAPLHREHDRYTASKKYRFIVMFQGEPLAKTPVLLETQNNTASPYTSDNEGIITVALPNDFTNVSIGRGQNMPSEFLLTTRHSDGNLTYQSTLSMPYSVNPNDYDFWQSQPLGAGAIFIGFLGGLFLYRRSKHQGAKHG